MKNETVEVEPFTVYHINESGDTLEIETFDKLIGDKFVVRAKNIEGYIPLQKQKTITVDEVNHYNFVYKEE